MRDQDTRRSKWSEEELFGIQEPIGEPGNQDEPLDPMYSDHPVPQAGVHAESGQPILPALSAREIVRVIKEKSPERLLGVSKEAGPTGKVLPPGLDPRDLTQTGWAIVCAESLAPAIEEALAPLIEHRQEGAGRLGKLGPTKLIYQPGESTRKFLARVNEAAPGVMDPEKIPYYLLLVGGPEQLPYRLQYELGVGYGVGRLPFENAEDVANYARTVVETEKRGNPLPRAVTLFGPQTDATTQRTTTEMIGPLADRLLRKAGTWSVRTCVRRDATKQALRELLDRGTPPGLLITASHGVGFDPKDPRQREQQGGLVCERERDAKGAFRPLRGDHYFCARDVPETADLEGLFSLLFSCFSAGTPRENDFHHEDGRRVTASEDFVARLPERLLSRGALGVIGHVDRAWTTTFSWTRNGRQVDTIEAVALMLMRGFPAGYALSFFAHRYAELATQLTTVWEQIERGGDRPSDRFLAWLWTAHNDARNMVLLGDPAARRVEFEDGG